MKLESRKEKFEFRDQSYKTFYDRNLGIFLANFMNPKANAIKLFTVVIYEFS
jgi:hypothetical protein